MGGGTLRIGIRLREFSFQYSFVIVMMIISNRTTDITTTASPGPHILSCEVMKETKDPGGGTEFRIIAVDAL